jgi:hypothetical protein
MQNIKFVVKVTRTGTQVAEYVKQMEKLPIQMTTQRKLALVMGRFAAEDAAKSIQNSRRTSELVPVNVDV